MRERDADETSHAGPHRAGRFDRRRAWTLLLLALAAVAILGIGGRAFPLQAGLQSVLEAIGRLGWWAPAAFVGIYVVACILMIPGAVLTLGAGALFGVGRGFLYAWTGATLGATAAFVIGRYVAQEWVARRMARFPFFAAVNEAVAREGWKIVGLLRLSPLVPFVLINYAFGLTRVSLRNYVLATWIGMVPGCLLYVYLGSVGRVAAGGESRSVMEWGIYAAGLGATLAAVILITRRARDLLRQKLVQPGRNPDVDSRPVP